MDNPFSQLFAKNPHGTDKDIKIPKKLGDAADLYYELRDARKWYNSRAEHLTRQLGLLEDHLRKELEAHELTAAKGKLATFSVDTEYTRIYRPKDFVKFMAWVTKNKAWDVLRKQVSADAIRSRIEAGERIPQLDFYEFRAHHSNKIGGK
jgi:hypothetical protein